MGPNVNLNMNKVFEIGRPRKEDMPHNNEQSLTTIKRIDSTIEALSLECLDGSDTSLQGLTPDNFSISDRQSANWLIRKVKERRAYAQSVQAWAQAELRRAEREERHLIERFGPQLECWLRSSLEEDGNRRRCLDLPAGRVGLRARPAQLVVTDESALVTWCRRNLAEALRGRVTATGADAFALEELAAWLEDANVVMAVGRAEVHQHFGETGEIPDGTEAAAGTDQLYIR